MHRHFFGHGEHRERHSRGPFGGRMGGPRGGGHHHRGGRIGRFLEHGDLRFVILALIEAQPRHGYELIKELEDRTGGAYRPSPGVIYPTLALLEDEGFVRQAGGETGRKLYEITDAGKESLDQNRANVDGVFARMDEASEGADVSRPRIGRAMANMAFSLKSRFSQGAVTPEQLDRIVAIIDEAAAAIEKA